MKKVLLLATALICAVSIFSSCNKEDDEEIVNIIGNWKYTGVELTGDDDLDIFKNYLFKIDESKILVYGMDQTSLTSEYAYTRQGNKLTFTPEFNGKYKTATVRQSYGSGTESFCWNCGNGQVYYFDKKN